MKTARNGSRNAVETAIDLAKSDRNRKWEDFPSPPNSRRWDTSEGIYGSAPQPEDEVQAETESGE